LAEGKKLKAIYATCAAMFSGILLFLSFPPFNQPYLIWIALVPLFLTLLSVRPVYGFLLSLTCGIVFFLGMFNWGLSVAQYTFMHHAILALCWSPHFCFFGLIMSFMARRLNRAAALYGVAFIWVSLEFIRSNLHFLSFPWGLLAHSQHSHPTLIQIASITGAYGVSFLIVLINSAITALVYQRLSRSNKTEKNFSPALSPRWLKLFTASAALLGALTFFYGIITVSKPLEGRKITVSAVQPNVEQRKKWDPQYESAIMRTLADLTREASKASPDLIVWPETATPRSITENYNLYLQIYNLARETGSPILLGSSERQKLKKTDRQDRKYFNSAFLIGSKHVQGSDGKPQRYDKIHLLPFGEYLPFEDNIPWSRINVPTISGYLPGKNYTVFKLPDFKFGATICWENIFPQVVRGIVLNGAQFVVNITNEAWFGRTAAAPQFVTMSVFRAVENGVYVVRCGNTGISCIIDRYGRITERLKSKDGRDLFVRGVLSGTVLLPDSNTFYTRHGDIFVYINLVVGACMLALAFARMLLRSSS